MGRNDQFEISKDLVIVTQIASGEQEGSLKIASRVFAVGLGVDEDSVVRICRLS